MRRKGAIEVRFGGWCEVSLFLVTLCMTTSCDFLDRIGTESANTKVSRCRPDPLRAWRPTSRLLLAHNGRATMNRLVEIRYRRLEERPPLA